VLLETETLSAPLVSIIILNYNGNNYLQACLQSVLNNRYPNFEVILVDNASTDNSLKDAKNQFSSDSRLKFVQTNKNLGFSGGNNVGFTHCKGDYVVFLNNDTLVEEDWLTKLVNAMQGDPQIGLAQSKIINMHNDEIQNAGWLFSNYLVRKHALGGKKPLQLTFKPVFEVSVASGASMMVSRELIQQVGLFEPKIPFFYDDTLLSFKVWLANKKVATVEGSKIRHIMGATNNWNLERTTYNLLKAKVCLLFDVYYNLKDLSRAVFVNVWFSLVSVIFLIGQNNLPAIYGIFNGLYWAFRNLSFLWFIRQKHWCNALVSPSELKDKFIKINIQPAFFLLPAKISNSVFISAVEEYEKGVIKC
jgi:GT2 family glycosyltransferase